MNISIVVPVFNTDVKQFSDCIKSCAWAIDEGGEIIVVDDGSDSKKAWDYKKILSDTFPGKFKYLKQKNSGVSSARNNGIKNSSGRYITFLDSDDCFLVNDEALKKITFMLREGKNDVFFFDGIMLKAGEKIVQRSVKNIGGGGDSREILKKIIIDDACGFIHAYFYKRDFLKKNDIRFKTDIIQREDYDFNLEVFSKEPQSEYISEPIYQYNYTPWNAINRWKSNPDRMIEVGENRYQNKFDLLKCLNDSKPDISEGDIDHLRLKRINSIFQNCVDLFCAGTFTKKRNEKLSSLMRKLEPPAAGGFKTKVVYNVVKYRLVIIPCIMSWFRMRHLKAKFDSGISK